MWLDDFINNTEQLEKARHINVKVDYLIKQKQLSLNEDKSVCLIIGSKKQKEKVTAELQENPLMCGQFVTKEIR